VTGGTAWPPGNRGLTEASVNTSTADGLKEALTDVRVVIDLSNSPPFDSRRCWNSSSPLRRVLTISAPDLGDVTLKMLMGFMRLPAIAQSTQWVRTYTAWIFTRTRHCMMENIRGGFIV
jgi:hypothetical protein